MSTLQSASMTNPYQPQALSSDSVEPWTWDLASHVATTLQAADGMRWLRVHSGSVWLTQADATEQMQAEDIWLSAGQSLALPAGSRWVLQAWPQARLSLLAQPPVVVRDVSGQARARAASSRRAWWRSLAA